jgi:AsmA protein
MNTLKYTGIAFGVVLVLILAGIAFVASQFDADRIKAELAKAVQESRQRTLKIDGELRLSLWPNIAIRIGKVSLSEHRSEQVFATVDSARVSVALMPLFSRQVVVNQVEISGASATLIKHKDGKLNIVDLLSPDGSKPAPEAKPEGASLQLDIAGIRLANVQLTWRDEKAGSSSSISGLDLSTGRVRADTGKNVFQIEALSLAAKGKLDADTFDLKLDVPKLSYAPDRSAGERLTLSATLAGPQRNLTAKLSLSGIEGTAKALKVTRLALSVEAKAGEATVKGTLDSELAADFERQIVALEKFTGAVDIAHPQMPMKQVKLPVNGRLKADLAAQAAEGNLATQFDESKIALKFNVAKFAPLALGFDLDIDRLNLDKYLPPGKPEAKQAGGEGKIDLSALKALNLRGTAKIGSLQVANVKAASVKLQISAAGGKLDIAPHSASLYEGTLAGALSVNANGNTVAIKENLAGVNINALMKDALAKDLLEGRGSVSMDVTAAGETVTAMKKALNGSASISLRDGAIKGIDLAKSFRELKSKFGAGQDAVQQAKAADKTDFSELSGTFKIANGVAHNEDLSAKSPFMRLSGAGDIDIGGSAMNYLGKASVVATSGGQGAGDLEHLKGVTVPVRVSGPFENLSYKIEFARLLQEATKARVEEKKQEVQQKLQDSAKDRLKGLFGK